MPRVRLRPAPAKLTQLAQTLGLTLWLLAGPALAQVGLPVMLDGKRLPAVEARTIDGEQQLPLLALAQALGVRVSTNRYAGTASMQGREFPISMVGETAYVAQSRLYPWLGLQVHVENDRIELCTPNYQPPSEVSWRGTGESAPLEVRSFSPGLDQEALVVRARVGASRRYASASGRVRVLLRKPDGELYATFVSPPQAVSEEQEADLVVATWLGAGVRVNPDQSIDIRDYDFKGIPAVTRRLTVEASAEP